MIRVCGVRGGDGHETARPRDGQAPRDVASRPGRQAWDHGVWSVETPRALHSGGETSHVQAVPAGSPLYAKGTVMRLNGRSVCPQCRGTLTWGTTRVESVRGGLTFTTRRRV